MAMSRITKISTEKLNRDLSRATKGIDCFLKGSFSLALCTGPPYTPMSRILGYRRGVGRVTNRSRQYLHSL